MTPLELQYINQAKMLMYDAKALEKRIHFLRSRHHSMVMEAKLFEDLARLSAIERFNLSKKKKACLNAETSILSERERFLASKKKNGRRKTLTSSDLKKLSHLIEEAL